MTITN
jgi:predicted ArsR family transcriptional regulator